MAGTARSYLSLLRRIWTAPGNAGHRFQAVTRSVCWLFNKHTARLPWTLPVFPGLGLRLRCHPSSIIALHVVQRSEWHDWDTAKFITSFLRAGDTFVDVGSNIGLYTLPAARIVGETGRVNAVEPSPVNRARLTENLAINHLGDVTVVPCALGQEAGMLTFADDDALAHVCLPAEVSDPAAVNGLQVPVQTLDAILPQNDDEIALMKVDVEGFEMSVFRGASEAMRAERLPVILFEMNHSLHRYGLSDAEVFGFLRSAGYEIWRYHHDTRQLLAEPVEGDLVACTKRGRQWIEERVLSEPGSRLA